MYVSNEIPQRTEDLGQRSGQMSGPTRFIPKRRLGLLTLFSARRWPRVLPHYGPTTTIQYKSDDQYLNLHFDDESCSHWRLHGASRFSSLLNRLHHLREASKQNKNRPC
jgi:hypothetical protein